MISALVGSASDRTYSPTSQFTRSDGADSTAASPAVLVHLHSTLGGLATCPICGEHIDPPPASATVSAGHEGLPSSTTAAPTPTGAEVKDAIEASPGGKNELQAAAAATVPNSTDAGAATKKAEGHDGSEQAPEAKAAKKATEAVSVKAPSQLSDEEKARVQQLQQRDMHVRQHEMAHLAAGGQYASSPHFSYEKGPDGQSYAVAGEVAIDVSPISDNPAATIAKMQVIKSSALAPADPSSQDRSVAAMADQVALNAQVELEKKNVEKMGKVTAEATKPEASGRGNVIPFISRPGQALEAYRKVQGSTDTAPREATVHSITQNQTTSSGDALGLAASDHAVASPPIEVVTTPVAEPSPQSVQPIAAASDGPIPTAATQLPEVTIDVRMPSPVEAAMLGNHQLESFRLAL